MTQTRMTTRLPTALADALATRAKANHRSVNGELCAILQAALSGTPEPRLCPYCSVAEGSLHHPDCHNQRLGKSVAMALGTKVHAFMEECTASEAAATAALKLCVESLDQLLPYLSKVPADVGLLNEALVAARPILKAAEDRAKPRR